MTMRATTARLAALERWLRSGRRVTLAGASAALGVNERTIKRDLADLRGRGVIVEWRAALRCYALPRGAAGRNINPAVQRRRRQVTRLFRLGETHRHIAAALGVPQRVIVSDLAILRASGVSLPSRIPHAISAKTATMTSAEYKSARRERGTQAAVAIALAVNTATIFRRETGGVPITREAELALLSLPQKRSRRPALDGPPLIILPPTAK